MERVRFNKCLNKEIRFFNISIGTIIGALAIGLLVWSLKSLLYGVGGGVVGGIYGGYLMKLYMLGDLQRKLYWQLPYSEKMVSKHLPRSHHRHLM